MSVFTYFGELFVFEYQFILYSPRHNFWDFFFICVPIYFVQSGLVLVVLPVSMTQCCVENALESCCHTLPFCVLFGFFGWICFFLFHLWVCVAYFPLQA